MLEQRLAHQTGDASAGAKLAFAALALLDEAQAKGAALALARCEIERLTDMLVEAKLDADPTPLNEERGRVDALRVSA